MHRIAITTANINTLIHINNMSTMAGIVKRIDLDGTFLRMKIGDAIKISILEETENNLRSKVSRYNKKHGVGLKVSIARGDTEITITRLS